MRELTDAERQEIIEQARKMDRNFDAYAEETSGPGQWEGMDLDTRTIAIAIHTFYLNGGSDEDGGSVELGRAYSRAGRAVLWTDDRGFHDLEIFEDKIDAINACAEEDLRQYTPSDEEIEQEAIDLAVNDAQMWDNLPQGAKEHYRKLAREGDEQ